MASVELRISGAWTTPRGAFCSVAEGIDQADRGVIEVAQVAGRQLSLAGEGDAGDQGVAQIDAAAVGAAGGRQE
jgi:hypothetical protein